MDVRISFESYKNFLELKNPTWGPDLSFINFDEFTYFIRSSDRAENKLG
jgi:Fe-S cluster assembly protein SufB